MPRSARLGRVGQSLIQDRMSEPLVSTMAKFSDKNLIWIDLEMTGLNPDDDVIIEIATVITDEALNVIAEGPVLAIHQSERTLARMDAWNTTHHHRSGLVERVRASGVNETQAMDLTLQCLRQWVPKGASPMCGNSICQDRRFLWNHMRELEQYFHYRNLDCSTFKEVARRWAPDVLDGVNKDSAHRALNDIYESIAELRHYREVFLRLPA